jgi:hypothetical protein
MIPDKIEWDPEAKSWIASKDTPDAITAEWDGEKWVKGKNPSGPGSLRRGFATGVESTKGLVADIIPAMVQSAFGYDEAAQKNLQEYRDRMKALEARNLLTRMDYQKVNDLGSAAEFAGEAIGESIPSLITTLAGGVGVGAAAARLGAGRLLTQQVGKKAAELEAKGVAKDAALQQATKEVSQQVGSVAGAFGGSALLNIPESYLNLAEAGNASLGASFAVGALKSTLDALGPIRLLSKTRGPDFSDKVTDLVSARLLKGRPGAAGALGGALETAALEGITEGTQQLLDETAAAILADKSIDWNNIINAALKGGVGSAPVGAAAGAYGARQKAAAAEAATQETQRAEAAKAATEEEQSYTAGRLAGEVPPPEKTASDYLYDTIAEVKTEFPGIQIQGEIKDNKPSFAIDPKSLRIKVQQLVQQGIVNPATNKPFTVPELEKALSSQIYSSLRTTYDGKSYERLAGAPSQTKVPAASSVDQASAIIAEVNQDPSSLENPFIAQQYDEAKRIVAAARDKETALREKEQEAAQVPLEGYRPRFGTAADITPAETPVAPDLGDVEVEATMAPPLRAWQRQAVENIITELQPGGTLSVASIQNELSKEGTPVSLEEANAILDRYVAEKNTTQGGMQIVPPNLRLVKRGDSYVKPRTGVAEEAYRGEAPDLQSERGGARAFPDAPQPLITEISSPVIPIQGTLQTPPAGLSQEDWAKTHNTLIRRTRPIDRDAVEAAAQRELSNKQVKEILDALVNTNAIKRAGLVYRANPDAQPISAFREEVVGGPTTQKPKEVVETETEGGQTRQMQVGRRNFIGLLAGAAMIALKSPARALNVASPELMFHLRNGDLPAALTWISTKSDSPIFRKVAAALLRAGMGNVKIRVIGNSKNEIDDAIKFGWISQKSASEITQGTLGFINPYEADNPTIILIDRANDRATGLSEEVLLHEALHAFVMSRWGLLESYRFQSNATRAGFTQDPGDLRKVTDLRNLWKALRDHIVINNMSLNAAQNPDEFFAYGLTDPKTRDFLESHTLKTNGKIVPIRKTSKEPSLLDKFFNWFFGLLGFNQNETTLLKQFEDTAFSLFDTPTAPDFDTARRLGNLAAGRIAQAQVPTPELGRRGFLRGVGAVAAKAGLPGTAGIQTAKAGLTAADKASRIFKTTETISNLKRQISDLGSLFQEATSRSLPPVEVPAFEQAVKLRLDLDKVFRSIRDITKDFPISHELSYMLSRGAIYDEDMKYAQKRLELAAPREYAIAQTLAKQENAARSELNKIASKFRNILETAKKLSSKDDTIKADWKSLGITEDNKYAFLDATSSADRYGSLARLADLMGLDKTKFDLTSAAKLFQDLKAAGALNNYSSFANYLVSRVPRDEFALITEETILRGKPVRSALAFLFDSLDNQKKGFEVLENITADKLEAFENQALRTVPQVTGEIQSTIKNLKLQFDAEIQKASPAINQLAKNLKSLRNAFEDIWPQMQDKYRSDRSDPETKESQESESNANRRTSIFTQLGNDYTWRTLERGILLPENAPKQLARMARDMIDRSSKLQDAATKSIPDDYSCG